jgi:hypothetical protein
MTKGVCPVCNGSGHMPCPDHLREHGSKNGWYGYRAEDDTVNCTNCGSQYMYGRATGEVNLNRDGVPCTHSYTSQNAGRCLTNYTCQNCDDRYQIDSGD